MSIFRTALTVSVITAAILTPSAHAQDVRLEHMPHTFDPGLSEAMIVGLTACTPESPVKPQVCLPIETGDQLAGRFDHRTDFGGKPGWNADFLFYKFHHLRPSIYYAMGSAIFFIPDDGSGPVLRHVSMPTYDPERNAPDCTRGEWTVALANGSIAATDDAPQEYVDFCRLVRVSQIPSTPPPAEPTPAPPTPPARPTACIAIVVARKKVTVVATGLQCSSARNVLARYMKKGAQPSGWVCSKLASGRARSATCGTPGPRAKRIVGRWRV